jgi:hypothetical protein
MFVSNSNKSNSTNINNSNNGFLANNTKKNQNKMGRNPKCIDNKMIVQSKIATNANFDFANQPTKVVIKYSATDPLKIVEVGLSYLELLSSSLSKLVVYCNQSNDEQLDAKITIKYMPCGLPNMNNENNNGTYYNWIARYTLPGTVQNSTTVRKLLQIRSVPGILKFISTIGTVNLVELHARGVKVSDDKEVMTLYYLPDA